MAKRGVIGWDQFDGRKKKEKKRRETCGERGGFI